MTVPPQPNASPLVLATLGRSQGESAVGLDGGSIPGDPAELQQIVDDFTYLRDAAWSVCQGLETFVASASSGGFEGATADALRGVISGRVKTFVYNMARAFSLAGDAVAEYKLALVQAQQTVVGVVTQAEGMTAKDPRLGGLKGQVSDQLAQVRDAEALMVRALQDASDMVSQPIMVPSLFEKIWKGVEESLMIAGMVAALLSTVVTGPLGEIAFGLAAASFGMSVADFARGRANWTGLLLSAVGMLLPGGKGIFSMEELGAGLRGALAGFGRVGGGAADALANPSKLAPLLVAGLARTGQALGRVPGLLIDAVKAVPSVITGIPGALKSFGGVIAQDFANVTERYPALRNVVGAHFGYAVVNASRFAGVLFTPMSFDEIATLGFRAAWQAAGKRASWTAAAQAFRDGWRTEGLRVVNATMDVWRIAHGVRSFPQDGTQAAPRAGAWVGAGAWAVPEAGSGPMKWAGSERRLREPVVSPVTTWTTRDRAHRIPPAPSRLQQQKIVQDGEGGLLTTRGGLLVPVEGVLPPQSLQSPHQLGPDGTERMPTGHLETVAGPGGLTAHLDGTTPVPHQDTSVPTAGDQFSAPVTSGWGARQTLDLLRAQTGAESDVVFGATRPLLDLAARANADGNAKRDPARFRLAIPGPVLTGDQQRVREIPQAEDSGRITVPRGSLPVEVHPARQTRVPVARVQPASAPEPTPASAAVSVPEPAAALVRLGGNLRHQRLGYLRIHHAASGREPEVVNETREVDTRLRAELLGDGTVRLVPVASERAGRAPLEDMVVHAVSGHVLEATVAANEQGHYWRINYRDRHGVLVDEAGKAVREEPARLVQLTSGGLRLIDPRGTVVFERHPVLSRSIGSDGEAEALRRMLAPEGPGALGVVRAEELIREARAGARAAGQDLSALLQRTRALRSAAHERLLEDAAWAVEVLAAMPEGGRHVLGGFEITALEGGRHEAVHIETGLRTVFDAQRRWISREVGLLDAGETMDGLRMVVSRKHSLTGVRTSYRLAGHESGMLARFRIDAGARGWRTSHHAAVITDLGTGNRYAFDDYGTLIRRDVWVGDAGHPAGLGYLWTDLSEPEGTVSPLMNARGQQVRGVRVEAAGEGRLRLVPITRTQATLEELVVDVRDGRLLSQTIAGHYAEVWGDVGYWRIRHDENGLSAEWIDASGQVLRQWPQITDELRSGIRQFFTPELRLLFWRPALGFRHPSSPVSRWLTRPGTVEHLPLNDSSCYHLCVPLPEGNRGARVRASGRGLRLLGWNGQVIDVPAEFVRDAQGLTVRLPVHRAPDGVRTEYRFNTRGLAVREEWPLTGSVGREMFGSLRVVVRGETSPREYELVGPSDVVARFQIDPLEIEEALEAIRVFSRERDMPFPKFAITERATGSRLYYADNVSGEPEMWDLRLDEDRGLRLVGAPDLASRVTDAEGEPVQAWRAAALGDGRIAVMREPHADEDALLVHTDSLRVDILGPEHVVSLTDGVTLRFSVPGAPEWVMGTYRFSRDGRLLHAEISLALGPEEATVASLRLVVLHTGDVRTRELRGGEAGLFRLDGIDELDATLAREAPDGFTVIEPYTFIRRRYTTGGRLVYRDVPLGPEECLRVGVGIREGALQVIGPHGDPLADRRVERLSDGRMAVVPTTWDHLPEGERPLTRTVADPARGLVEEILAVHVGGAAAPSWYWKLDYLSRSAVPLNGAGQEMDRAVYGARLVVSPELTGRIVVRGGRDVVFDRSTWDIVAGRRRDPLPEPPAAKPPVAERTAMEAAPAGARVVRDMALPLEGRRLLVLETGEGPEAVRRLEVVDLRTPEAETGWTASERFGGGFVIVDPTGDRRWYVTPDNEIEHQDVRLAGTERFVRFDADGGGPSIVEANGEAVEDGYVLEPVIDDSTAQETGLTVRLSEDRQPGPGVTVVWHLDAERLPVHTEVHLEPYAAHRAEWMPYPEWQRTAEARHGESSGHGHGHGLDEGDVPETSTQRTRVPVARVQPEPAPEPAAVLVPEPTPDPAAVLVPEPTPDPAAEPAPELVRLGGNLRHHRLGYLRIHHAASGREPEAVNEACEVDTRLRAELLGDGTVRLAPVAGERADRASLEDMVVCGVSGHVLEATVVAHEPGHYWRINYSNRHAVRIDEAGEVVSERPARLVELDGGGFQLVDPSGAVAFERHRVVNVGIGAAWRDAAASSGSARPATASSAQSSAQSSAPRLSARPSTRSP